MLRRTKRMLTLSSLVLLTSIIKPSFAQTNLNQDSINMLERVNSFAGEELSFYLEKKSLIADIPFDKSGQNKLSERYLRNLNVGFIPGTGSVSFEVETIIVDSLDRQFKIMDVNGKRVRVFKEIHGLYGKRNLGTDTSSQVLLRYKSLEASIWRLSDYIANENLSKTELEQKKAKLNKLKQSFENFDFKPSEQDTFFVYKNNQRAPSSTELFLRGGDANLFLLDGFTHSSSGLLRSAFAIPQKPVLNNQESYFHSLMIVSDMVAVSKTSDNFSVLGGNFSLLSLNQRDYFGRVEVGFEHYIPLAVYGFDSYLSWLLPAEKVVIGYHPNGFDRRDSSLVTTNSQFFDISKGSFASLEDLTVESRRTFSKETLFALTSSHLSLIALDESETNHDLLDASLDLSKSAAYYDYKNSEYYVQQGVILAAMGQFHRSKGLFEQAIDNDSTNLFAYYNLSITKLVLGTLKYNDKKHEGANPSYINAAIEDLNKVIELDSSFTEAYYALSLANVLVKDTLNALKNKQLYEKFNRVYFDAKSSYGSNIEKKIKNKDTRFYGGFISGINGTDFVPKSALEKRYHEELVNLQNQWVETVFEIREVEKLMESSNQNSSTNTQYLIYSKNNLRYKMAESERAILALENKKKYYRKKVIELKTSEENSLLVLSYRDSIVLADNEIFDIKRSLEQQEGLYNNFDEQFDLAQTLVDLNNKLGTIKHDIVMLDRSYAAKVNKIQVRQEKEIIIRKYGRQYYKAKREGDFQTMDAIIEKERQRIDELERKKQDALNRLTIANGAYEKAWLEEQRIKEDISVIEQKLTLLKRDSSLAPSSERDIKFSSMYTKEQLDSMGYKSIKDVYHDNILFLELQVDSLYDLMRKTSNYDYDFNSRYDLLERKEKVELKFVDRKQSKFDIAKDNLEINIEYDQKKIALIESFEDIVKDRPEVSTLYLSLKQDLVDKQNQLSSLK